MEITIKPSIPERVRALSQSHPDLRPEDIARRLGLLTSQVKAAIHADRRQISTVK